MAASAAGHRIILTVIVHDAEGRVSSALDVHDFVISENGRPQSISLFRNLRPPQELIVKRPPADYMISNRPFAAFESQPPVHVLILDTRNTDPEFQPWMRSQVLRFVSMLRPDADVAFYQLAASGLRLLHQFSHDKSHLKAAIAGVLEPATAREFERESSAEAAGIERYQQTCEAISQMAQYLGRFERRKNLIWLSGDFPPVFETENKRTHSASPECAAMAITLNRANTALYPADVRSPIAKEPFQQVPPGDLDAVPRNRREALSRDWLHTMTTLAALTGGRPIENRSQLAEAMIDALNETRFAYELGFNIPPGECDGKLHALRVQVHIRDAAVLAKQAFVAECGAQQAGRTPPGQFDSPAIGLSVIPAVQIGAEFPTRVRVLIASSDLQWSKAGNSLHSSVGIRIEEKTAAGEERVLTSQRVQLTAGDEKPQPAAAELALKPDAGVETLRLILRDELSQREGSVTFPLNNQPQ